MIDGPLKAVSVACGMLCVALLTLGQTANLPAQEPTSEMVLKSIERGRTFLVSKQNANGSWPSNMNERYPTGATSLAVLALLNSGLDAKHPVVAKGLNFLRSTKEPEPSTTYETSLLLSVYAAAHQYDVDRTRAAILAQKLEASIITRGPEPGNWGYNVSLTGSNSESTDRSNGQFAILGLREAVYMDYRVDRKTWDAALKHWVGAQNGDGGWGYRGGVNESGSTGSMTCAGISSVSICQHFLRDEEALNPDGTPICCVEPKNDMVLERAYAWMDRNFTTSQNPASGEWWLYYLYGLERAGRLSGQRFFGDNDWYRDGVRKILQRQNGANGEWRGLGSIEAEPTIGTSLALLFLSKGLSPVLINKVKYGKNAGVAGIPLGGSWNKHPLDARNLTEFISTRPRWPKLISWQELDLSVAAKTGSVADLLQAPILYISGDENINPYINEAELSLLRDYVYQGGFIFAVANCKNAEFDDGIRQLVRRMYPNDQIDLRPLPPDHPIYRSDYLLAAEGVELEGADIGCRTAIVYSPYDHSCLWDKWSIAPSAKQTQAATSSIFKSLSVGVNVIAYATGRELPDKLKSTELLADSKTSLEQQRGNLQLAKLRYEGDWNTAPNAIVRMLNAVNESVGVPTVAEPKQVAPSSPELYRYAMVMMHGQRNFNFSVDERDRLKSYLENGGVLFADACCGAEKFDASFRQLMTEMFGAGELKRIPLNDELFGIFHKLQTVKRRESSSGLSGGGDRTIETNVKDVEPFLEGIQINGRFVVVYSKYDISCALEKQNAIGCEGYVTEDATRLAMNIVMYSILQNLSAEPPTEPKNSTQ
ncbi:DUF4159 domain-containing protein [Lacunimicrobium album]